jgi:hypothetical protein
VLQTNLRWKQAQFQMAGCAQAARVLTAQLHAVLYCWHDTTRRRVLKANTYKSAPAYACTTAHLLTIARHSLLPNLRCVGSAASGKCRSRTRHSLCARQQVAPNAEVPLRALLCAIRVVAIPRRCHAHRDAVVPSFSYRHCLASCVVI